MKLSKLIDRMEYLLFALVLLPTFLVIGAAVMSLVQGVHAMERELWETAIEQEIIIRGPVLYRLPS